MTHFGLVLPTMHPGASREVIEAAAEAAERLGWGEVWSTDHVLVPHGDADEYGRIYEALISLAWVAARAPGLAIGVSVLIPAQRNAVVLAKELATLDDLSGGRLTVGVGSGWVEGEFENLGAADRFHVRGAYVEETIALWRHLWSGSGSPFEGRFHRFSDFLFEPLPVRRERLPIVIGGPSRAVLERAGRLADGFQSAVAGPAAFAEAIPVIRAAAEAAGRPMPSLAARLNVRFGEPAGPLYALVGTPDEMVEQVRAFVELGVDHFVVGFEPRQPEAFVAAVERFDRDVVRRVGDGRR